MELQSLNDLDRQISRFLEKYRTLKSERDEVTVRIQQLEAENFELRRSSESLQQSLDDARRNVRDPDKEERIKSKVDELLAKLEGF